MIPVRKELNNDYFQPFLTSNNNDPRYKQLIEHLPTIVKKALQTYKTTRAKLERYVTEFRDPSKFNFLKNRPLDKISRAAMAAYLENLISFEELTTLHQLIAAHDTLYVNPKVFVRIQNFPGKIKDIEVNLKDQFTPEEYRLKYYDKSEVLKEFFGLDQLEWDRFEKEMSQKPELEQFYYIFVLPQTGSISPLYDKILRSIRFLQPVFLPHTNSKGRPDTIKCMVIPSFSMLQLMLDIKATTPIQLTPMLGICESNGDILKLKKKRETPLRLYCPPPRYFGKKVSQEDKALCEEITDESQKIDKIGKFPINPLTLLLNDFYLAVREIAMNDQEHALRFQLIDLIKQGMIENPGTLAYAFCKTRGRMIHGALLNSRLPSLLVDTSPNPKLPLLDQFLCLQSLKWNPQLSDYIRSKFHPTHIVMPKQIAFREAFVFDEQQYLKAIDGVPASLIPYKTFIYLLDNEWKSFVSKSSRIILNKQKLDELSLRTSCVLTAFCLNALFVGIPASQVSFRYFQRPLTLTRSLETGAVQWKFKISELIGGSVVEGLKKSQGNFPVVDMSDGTCARLAVQAYTKFEAHILEHANEKLAKSRELTDDHIATKVDLVLKNLFHKCTYDFNQPVIDGLKAVLSENALKTTPNMSHAYIVYILHPTDLPSTVSSKAIYHTYLIEQFMSEDGEVRHRMYQSWIKAETPKEYEEKTQGKTYTTKEILKHLVTLSHFLDPEFNGPKNHLRKELFAYDCDREVPVTYFQVEDHVLKGMSFRYNWDSFDPAQVPNKVLALLRAQ